MWFALLTLSPWIYTDGHGFVGCGSLCSHVNHGDTEAQRSVGRVRFAKAHFESTDNTDGRGFVMCGSLCSKIKHGDTEAQRVRRVRLASSLFIHGWTRTEAQRSLSAGRQARRSQWKRIHTNKRICARAFPLGLGRAQGLASLTF